MTPAETERTLTAQLVACWLRACSRDLMDTDPARAVEAARLAVAVLRVLSGEPAAESGGTVTPEERRTATRGWTPAGEMP